MASPLCSLYGNYIFIMCFTYIAPYFGATVVSIQYMNNLNVAQSRLEVINR